MLFPSQFFVGTHCQFNIDLARSLVKRPKFGVFLFLAPVLTSADPPGVPKSSSTTCLTMSHSLPCILLRHFFQTCLPLSHMTDDGEVFSADANFSVSKTGVEYALHYVIHSVALFNYILFGMGNDIANTVPFYEMLRMHHSGISRPHLPWSILYHWRCVDGDS